MPLGYIHESQIGRCKFCQRFVALDGKMVYHQNPVCEDFKTFLGAPKPITEEQTLILYDKAEGDA